MKTPPRVERDGEHHEGCALLGECQRNACGARGGVEETPMKNEGRRKMKAEILQDDLIIRTRQLLRRAAASDDEVEMAEFVLEIAARLRKAALKVDPASHLLKRGPHRWRTLAELLSIDPPFLAWMAGDDGCADDVAVAAGIIHKLEDNKAYEAGLRAWNGEQPK